MKNTALLLALSLTALACDSGDDGPDGDGGLGSVALNDSTDATGKADALMGREVAPRAVEIVTYSEQSKSGVSEVTDVSDARMQVQGTLVELQSFEESLQVTIAGDEGVDMRFFLVRDAGEYYEILTVDGNGDFEDGDEPDGGDAQQAPVTVSYFQSVTIDTAQNTISMGSDTSGGQTTSVLDFDASQSSFAVLALPIDSGVGNSLVGEFNYTLDAQCDGYECGQDAPAEPDVPVDDYAQARDPDLLEVTIGGPAIDYTPARVDTGFGLGGTEFWQKWAGGHNPTYSYGAGTEAGRKCMLASAIRFETIMSDPPESIVELRENSNWSGRFFNWNDDFSESSSDARYAVLWAWRTGLIKWISQTAQDGTCFLPTRDVVDRAARNCLSAASSDGGEIEGCQG